MNHILKELMGENAFLELRKIFTDWDPMFLMWACQIDEYDSEVNMILKQLHSKITREEIYKVVCKVILERFSISCESQSFWMRKSSYIDMANEIFEWIQFGGE